MKHPPEAWLLAHIDGELAEDREVRLQRHLVRCARCRARLAETTLLAGSVAGATQWIDAAEPASWSARETIVPVAQSTPVNGRRSRFQQRGILRWAAVFVGGTVTIAGAVLIGRMIPAGPASPVPPVATSSAWSDAAGHAVYVRPLDGAVQVSVRGAVPGSVLIVESADIAEVAVRVAVESEPQFRARDGSVEVDLVGEATVRVRVPATLRSGIVRMGSAVVRIEHGRVDPAEAVRGLRID